MAKNGFGSTHMTSASGVEDARNPGLRTRSKTSFLLAESVLTRIMATIGSRRAESGGVLGGDRTSNSISDFHFDEGAKCNAAAYSPDHHYLNTVLFPTIWKPRGIKLIGFVHSHPRFIQHPSGGDLIYAEAILKAIPELDSLFVPIVMTVPDTDRFSFLPYAVVRRGKGVAVIDAECLVTHRNGTVTTVRQWTDQIEMTAQPQTPIHKSFAQKKIDACLRVEPPSTPPTNSHLAPEKPRVGSDNSSPYVTYDAEGKLHFR